MGIFTRFTLKSLKQNRTRTAVSIFGVALSVALITAVLTSVVSLTNMLIERTASDEGWWYAEAAGITAEDLERLQNDQEVTDLTVITDMGTISLGEDNSDIFGKYLYAKTWPHDLDASEPLISTPEIVAGRAPEAPGEILLPHSLQNAELAPCGLTTADGGPIEVGSRITLDLGTRTVTNREDGASVTTTAIRGDYIDEATQTETYEADLGHIEGTVVGFYRAYGYSTIYSLQGNIAYVYDDGNAVDRAITDDSAATWAGAIFRTANPADAEPLADEIVNVHERTTDGASTVHSSLIRWMGVTPDTAIWNTLYQIAAILAAVVVIAGVSLVYNSFAISVAERTRQFGLLSSLGASRRQLRCTVFTEALIIGGIGIPVGLALGLIGCYVVFGILGEGIAMMAGGAEARVVVSPIALGIAALLGLITLIVSAWIPAVRASHVSALDAIRQVQDVHLSRRARRSQRRAARRGERGSLARPLGLAGRIFGIPGFIAHKNLTRASSKGRVTVAALAVSVALLITSGSIADVMSYASDTAVDTMEGQDLLLYIDVTGAGADQTLALADGKVNGPAMQQVLGRFYADVQDVDGATPNGYTTSYVADALIPSGMLSDDVTSLNAGVPPLSDGSWYGSAYVDFLDEATWEAYVDELGLSREEFCDPAHPRAIAVNSYDVNNGETYGHCQPFTGTGTIESLEFADLDGRFVSTIEDDPAGGLRALYYDDEGEAHYLPYDEAIASEQGIEVGALADTRPTCVTSSGTLQLILPASAIDLAQNSGYLRASMSFDTGGDAARATELQDSLEKIAADYPELDITYTNVAQGKLQARLMATTVNTFIYCFAVITGLIAVANVFNTLANALILRRREFAMLKSIGMGNRAFRRMIAYECASYALRGLVIGFALAALATLGLHESMRLSFSTYEPALPWMQIGASVAIVLAVILASVAYALMRSRTANVVEALREDAI
ncbi:ABC transporter permease [Collinsella tanakaei]|uniref:ABC transporter permease n=1 Tax=Collinsella tanakaei TaxID=626935 RepID=UPI001F21CC3C|nr:ABC transporter permease [Collinsella tanakaei]MCF2620680.1 ABC transporter permease [Collinsella tanakaei]